MTTPVPRCRGFTNPIIFLVRNSLQTSVQQSGRRTTTRLQWSRRSLSTGRSQGAQPKSKVVPRTSSPTPTAALSRHLEAAQIGYAQSLARKSTPTILYEAPPQRVFLVSSYVAGLFGMLSAGINVYFNVYNTPEGTSIWITYVFGAVGAMMAALGTRFAMLPSGMIRSIAVLPSATAPAATPTAQAAKTSISTAAKAKAKAATATSASTAPVLLEIKARRTTPFPFLPLKRMQISPSEVVMKARLFNPRPLPLPSERAASRVDEERRRRAAQQYERDHLMTAPFRHGAWAAGTVMASLRRGLTGEGFAPIEVAGAKYKLDITRGYALDEGRALDRVVRIEEDSKVAAAAAAAAAAQHLLR
ncbi:hypothetical protein MGN70_010628 [Eutypa lata]|nr:hypothetical protein MGN70_010628 [Eutypa lata]